MQVTCPDCGQPIPPQNVNVSTDLAQCAACGAVHRLSTLLPAPPSPSAAPVRSEPPAGSSLQVSRELDGLRIHLPRRRGGCSTFFQAGFALFWLSFVSVWTFLAASAAAPFAAFSIPFWCVGGFLLLNAINTLTETQTLTLSRSHLLIEKKRLLFSKVHDFGFQEIQAVRLEGLRGGPMTLGMRGQGFARGARYGPAPLVPAVLGGAGTVYFFENANTAEQEWIVSLLQSKISEA